MSGRGWADPLEAASWRDCLYAWSLCDAAPCSGRKGTARQARSFLIVRDRTLVCFGRLRPLLLLLSELLLLPLLHDVGTRLQGPTYLEVILIVVAAFLLSHRILTM